MPLGRWGAGVGRMPAEAQWKEGLEGKSGLCRWEKSSAGRAPLWEPASLWLQRRQLGDVRSEGQVRGSFVVGYCKDFGFIWKGRFLSVKTQK